MSSDEYKICPYCGEEIKQVALKCKHCKMLLYDEELLKGQKRQDANIYATEMLKDSSHETKYPSIPTAPPAMPEKRPPLQPPDPPPPPREKAKNYIVWYILAGLFLLFFILFYKESILPLQLSQTSTTSDKGNSDNAFLKSNYDVESLKTADLNQRSHVKHRADMVHWYNGYGLRKWSIFLEAIYSEEQTPQHIVEHIGKSVSDHIAKHVISSQVKSEDVTNPSFG